MEDGEIIGFYSPVAASLWGIRGAGDQTEMHGHWPENRVSIGGAFPSLFPKRVRFSLAFSFLLHLRCSSPPTLSLFARRLFSFSLPRKKAVGEVGQAVPTSYGLPFLILLLFDLPATFPVSYAATSSSSPARHSRGLGKEADEKIRESGRTSRWRSAEEGE